MTSLRMRFGYADVLLLEVRLLVSRGVVNIAKLDDLQGTNGIKNVAVDLLALMNVLVGVWPLIKDKTFLSEAELNLAQQYAAWMMRVVGEREQGPAIIAAATELRNRAFTMVMLTYQDARRALTYLLDDEDKVDAIVPGLRPGRPSRAKKEEPVSVAARPLPRMRLVSCPRRHRRGPTRPSFMTTTKVRS